MYDLSLEGMLEAGFSKKMAKYFENLLKHEEERCLWSNEELEWAHSRGFLAESVAAYNLTEENVDSYLSDYEYFRIWPLNNWERIWINDKLTMKHIFYGTKFDKYMPKYYYYKTPERLMPLMDCPKENDTADVNAVFRLLKKEKKLACKPCNGSLSNGFFQIAYESNEILINGEKVDEGGIKKFIEQNNNYVYTEYFNPEEKMAEIFPLIHTMRVLVINSKGNNPRIAGAYLRFGTKNTGYANYTNCSENVEFVYDVDIDLDSGDYYGGKLVFADHVEDSPRHPDTDILVEGTIDCWNEIKEMVFGVAKHLKQCEYLGFDVCITNNGIKIMEINSHSGIKHIQLRRPLLEGWTKDYYMDKIDKINELTVEQKKNRNYILR